MSEDEWKKNHLADLHRLAREDGEATRVEFLAILEVEERLKVGIAQCSAAMRDSLVDPQISGGSGDPATDFELLTDLYTIGFVDGTLDSREQLLIREFRRCTDLLECEDAAAFEAGRRQALDLIEELVGSDPNEAEPTGDERIRDRIDMRRRHFANLFRVALADGGLSGRELLVLLDAERAWFLPGTEFVDGFNRAERDPRPDPVKAGTAMEGRRMAMDLFAVAAADCSFDGEPICPDEEAVLHGILCPIHAPELIEALRSSSNAEAKRRVLHAIKIYGR